MAFPANCHTGVFQVDSFASTPYEVFEIISDEDLRDTDASPLMASSPLSLPDEQLLHQRQLTSLQHLEHLCRTQGGVVAVERRATRLWAFGSTDDTMRLLHSVGCAATESGSNIMQFNDIKLRKAKSGIFQALLLGQPSGSPPPMTAIAPSPISAPPASAAHEQNMNAVRLLNARGTLANRALSATTSSNPTLLVAKSSTQPPAPPDDRDIVYGWLVMSIVSLLSYQLASRHAFIPLNFRTFVLPRLPNDLSSSDTWLTTLDVRLTTGGTLLVSSSTVRQPGLASVADSASVDVPQKTELWIAPGGKIARYLGKEPVADTEVRRERKTRRRKVAQRSEEALARRAALESIQQWKAEASRWLSQKGIQLDDGRASRRWVLLEVWAPREAHHGVFATSQEQRESARPMLCTILWPERLCFRRNGREVDTASTPSIFFKPAEASDDLLPPADEIDSFLARADPLAFAEDWFLQAGARAKKIASRSNAKQTPQSVEQPAASPSGFYYDDGSSGVSSIVMDGTQKPKTSGKATLEIPEITRSAVSATTALKDHSNEASLRPLPTPLPTPAPTKTPSIAAKAEEAAPPDSVKDVQRESVERKASLGTVFDLGSANFGTGDGGMPFGHLDEDMFNEIGVTEEDFSFFDDPRQEDAGQQGVPDVAPQFGRISLDETARAGGLLGNASLGSRDPQNGDPGLVTGSDWIPTLASVPEETEAGGAALSALADANLQNRPLTPSTIMKRLLPEQSHTSNISVAPTSGSLGESERNPKRRKLRGFEPIQFNAVVDETRVKYAPNGRFSFPYRPKSPPSRERSDNLDHRIPRLDSARLQEDSSSDDTSLDGTATPTSEVSEDQDPLFLHLPAFVESPGNLDDGRSQTRTLQSRSPLSSTSVKRKRGTVTVDDGDTLSPWSNEGQDLPTILPPALDFLGGSAGDWSMAGFFSSRPHQSGRVFTLSGGELIDTAQLVAMQFLSGMPRPFSHKTESDGAFDRSMLRHDAVVGHAGRVIEAVTRSIFAGTKECDLAAYAAVEDKNPATTLGSRGGPLLRPPSDLKRKTSLRNETVATAATTAAAAAAAAAVAGVTVASETQEASLQPLPPPYIRVRRGDSPLQILPPALYFWENFGFEPYSGPKDVTFFCVYPDLQGIQGPLNEFLDALGTAYEACRLGRHRRGDIIAYSNGCVPVNLNFPMFGDHLVGSVMHCVRETCTSLGGLLQNLRPVPQNVVIYLVNPFNHADAIVDLCAAFVALFYAYAGTPAYQEAERHELVLQIVPVHLVLSDRTLPAATRSELVKLALSVYERCILINGKGKHYGGGVASSVMLVPPLPTRIQFALSADPPRSLLDDHRCLHIAYSCGMDDRWVSVAWSDSLGGMQMFASFCLALGGGSGGMAASSRSRRPFWEVAKEVWERSVELVCAQRERASWRFLLVRSGVMEQHEIDAWIALAATPIDPPVALTLLSADPHPPINLRCDHWFRGWAGADDAPAPDHVDSPLRPLRPQPSTTLSQLSSSLSFSTAAGHVQSSDAFSPAPFSTPTAATATRSTASTMNTGGATAFTSAGAAATPTSATAAPSLLPPLMTASAVVDSTTDLGPDATLVDVSDETWALVLQHRLHNTHSLVAHCPALASGLLVRRGGPLHDERPASLAVSILYYVPSPTAAPGTGADPGPGPGFTQQQQQRKQQQQQQQHLRDVLAMYRGLAVLAQFKRVVVVAPAGEGGDERAMRNVVPWHLAAAIRTQEALTSLM